MFFSGTVSTTPDYYYAIFLGSTTFPNYSVSKPQGFKLAVSVNRYVTEAKLSYTSAHLVHGVRDSLFLFMQLDWSRGKLEHPINSLSNFCGQFNEYLAQSLGQKSSFKGQAMQYFLFKQDYATAVSFDPTTFST